jgi:hypothetical protein
MITTVVKEEKDILDKREYMHMTGRESVSEHERDSAGANRFQIYLIRA